MNSADTLRAFIAIELNEIICSELAVLQTKLKTSGADVKWVKPEDIHLTLKFLGNTKKDKIEKIKNILDSMAGRTKAFDISLSSIGAFPSLNSPRVIWVGIKEIFDPEAGSALALMVSEIEEKLSKSGFSKENRPFAAHLTIGRVRSLEGKRQLKEIITDINKHAGECPPVRAEINHITLFQSKLTPKGPVYTVLSRANLKSPKAA